MSDLLITIKINFRMIKTLLSFINWYKILNNKMYKIWNKQFNYKKS